MTGTLKVHIFFVCLLGFQDIHHSAGAVWLGSSLPFHQEFHEINQIPCEGAFGNNSGIVKYSSSPLKKYVVGTHQKHLTEAFQMSTHIIWVSEHAQNEQN